MAAVNVSAPLAPIAKGVRAKAGKEMVQKFFIKDTVKYRKEKYEEVK